MSLQLYYYGFHYSTFLHMICTYVIGGLAPPTCVVGYGFDLFLVGRLLFFGGVILTFICLLYLLSLLDTLVNSINHIL